MTKQLTERQKKDPRYEKMQELIKEGRYDVYSASIAAGYSQDSAKLHSRQANLTQLADQAFARLCKNAQQAAVSTAYQLLRESKSEITKGKMAALLMKETGLKDMLVPKDGAGNLEKLDVNQLKALSGQLALLVQQGERNEKVINDMPELEEDDFGLLS